MVHREPHDPITFRGPQGLVTFREPQDLLTFRGPQDRVRLPTAWKSGGTRIATGSWHPISGQTLF